MRKPSLTEKDIQWLIENYPKMRNSELAVRLNVKPKTIENYAFRYSLTKCKEHISLLRRAQANQTNLKRWRK